MVDLPDNERRRECDLEFSRIWESLSKGDGHFQRLDTNDRQQDKDIKELQTNMVSLIKTISGLTRAIWGAVLTIIGAGASFFVWYIQSLGGR